MDLARFEKIVLLGEILGVTRVDWICLLLRWGVFRFF
jgi:hypothetical protein